jgi:hypothetical protein
MGSNTSSAMQPLQGVASLPILATGDAHWAQREPARREADVAMDWPEDLLLSFSLRMAGHGMSVSRTLMHCDRRYAMQQLMFAHSLKDTRLLKLAAQLVFHFEERQNGRTALH